MNCMGRKIVASLDINSSLYNQKIHSEMTVSTKFDVPDMARIPPQTLPITQSESTSLHTYSVTAWPGAAERHHEEYLQPQEALQALQLQMIQ